MYEAHLVLRFPFMPANFPAVGASAFELKAKRRRVPPASDPRVSDLKDYVEMVAHAQTRVRNWAVRNVPFETVVRRPS